ncbi:hypothetical protein BDQ12DRAFT_694393, partial [Crucibulum laeve]
VALASINGSSTKSQLLISTFNFRRFLPPPPTSNSNIEGRPLSSALVCFCKLLVGPIAILRVVLRDIISFDFRNTIPFRPGNDVVTVTQPNP